MISDSIYEELRRHVQLPSDSWAWTFHSANNIARCSATDILPDGCLSIKTLCVVSTTTANLYCGEKIVTSPSAAVPFQSHDELSGILRSFASKQRCQGILDTSLFNVKVKEGSSSSTVQDGNVRRYTSCHMLAERNGLCKSCQKARACLRKKVNHCVKNGVNESRQNPIKKVKNAHQQIRRMKSREAVQAYKIFSNSVPWVLTNSLFFSRHSRRL